MLCIHYIIKAKRYDIIARYAGSKSLICVSARAFKSSIMNALHSLYHIFFILKRGRVTINIYFYVLTINSVQLILLVETHKAKNIVHHTQFSRTPLRRFCTLIQSEKLFFPYTTVLCCMKAVFGPLMNGGAVQKT